MDLNIQKYFSDIRKHGNMFQTYHFYKSQKLKMKNSELLERNWKRRGPKHDEDPSEYVWNLGYGTNIYLKTWNGNFGNRAKKRRHEETKKRRNEETKKRRNEEMTKRRNEEMEKWRNEEMKKFRDEEMKRCRN